MKLLRLLGRIGRCHCYNEEIEDGGGRMKKALPVGVDNFEKLISGG